MKILRTDGGGEDYADKRLNLMKKMLLHFDLKHIFLLHDHKGNLSVTWFTKPTKEEEEKVSLAWEFFGEYIVEQKVINLKNL